MNSARTAAILLAAAVLVSQAFAAQHVHVDDTSPAQCELCAHADNAPAPDLDPPAAAPVDADEARVEFRSALVSAQRGFAFRVRAPPSL